MSFNALVISTVVVVIIVIQLARSSAIAEKPYNAQWHCRLKAIQAFSLACITSLLGIQKNHLLGITLAKHNQSGQNLVHVHRARGDKNGNFECDGQSLYGSDESRAAGFFLYRL